jgi:hypothetical protein
VLFGGHSFNEVFSKELNKWVFVDLTSKAIFVTSASGEYLNTIDLYHSHLLNSDSLRILTVEHDTLKYASYNAVKPFYNDYFSRNTGFMFYLKDQFDKATYDLKNKITRYISKSPTFVSYSDCRVADNEKFYIKIAFLYGLFSFTVYWIFCAFLMRYLQSKSRQSNSVEIH